MELRLDVSPGELTRAEQKILDYINTNPDTFLFLSIGQLAQRLELSDATVSRFARHVGCTDFKDLKMPGDGASLRAGGQNGGHPVPGGCVFSRRVAGAPAAVSGENRPAAGPGGIRPRAAAAITDARQIFLHGKNASAPLAQMLAFRLRRLGLQVLVLPSGGSEVLEGLSQAGEGRSCGDVQLFQALPGRTRHPGAQPARGLPDPGLCEPHLHPAPGAGRHHPLCLPGRGKGVPLHGRPRRPAGRSGGGR